VRMHSVVNYRILSCFDNKRDRLNSGALMNQTLFQALFKPQIYRRDCFWYLLKQAVFFQKARKVFRHLAFSDTKLTVFFSAKCSNVFLKESIIWKTAICL
jgi:hypothetical protein